MKIQVTAEHIKNGARQSACRCPIALALGEIGLLPSVGDVTCSVFINNDDKSFKLPSEATQFVKDFDKGLEVHPFAFELVEPA